MVYVTIEGRERSMILSVQGSSVGIIGICDANTNCRFTKPKIFARLELSDQRKGRMGQCEVCRYKQVVNSYAF